MTTNEKMIILYGPGPEQFNCRQCRYCQGRKCKLINAPVFIYARVCGKFEGVEEQK